MAVESVKPRQIRAILVNVQGFLNVPAHRYWIDYDAAADVLYLGFRKPQRATNSEMLEGGVIVRKAGKRIVGHTILNASRSG